MARELGWMMQDAVTDSKRAVNWFTDKKWGVGKPLALASAEGEVTKALARMVRKGPSQIQTRVVDMRYEQAKAEIKMATLTTQLTAKWQGR